MNACCENLPSKHKLQENPSYQNNRDFFTTQMFMKNILFQK